MSDREQIRRDVSVLHGAWEGVGQRLAGLLAEADALAEALREAPVGGSTSWNAWNRWQRKRSAALAAWEENR